MFQTRNVILGCGISGLATGYYLLRIGQQHVRILEATNRVGGWIRSTSIDDGIIFEQSARTLRPQGPQGANTLQLTYDLGLSQEILSITREHPTAKNRMIYVNKQLHTLPSNFLALFATRAPFTKSFIRFFLNDLITKKTKHDDESIYEFTRRRFGKEIADYAISPLICGICAGDAKEISVNFLMKSLFEKEQKYGSIFNGLFMEMFKKKNKIEFENNCELINKAKREKWSVWSLKNGLETLPKTLHKHLIDHGANIQLNSKCEEITFTNDNKCIIKYNNGQIEKCDRVFSSLPSGILADLIKKQHPDLAMELISIPYVTVGVVNFHYKQRVIQQNAFGFLIPPSENLSILGVIFDSCCFPNENQTILTCMLGGRWFLEKFTQSHNISDQLLHQSKKYLADILNINQEPDNVCVSILKNCIPQYIVGHNARLKRIKNYIDTHKLPLYLVGNLNNGVGINDVIFHAKNTVEDIYK